MKLATWNINSLTVRLPQVLEWLAANPVDVLALQELKLSDDKFPLAELQAAGYTAGIPRSLQMFLAMAFFIRRFRRLHRLKGKNLLNLCNLRI